MKDINLERRIRAREAELQILAAYFQQVLLAAVLPQITAALERESK